MLGKGLVRVRGRSDDGQVVTWMSGECQGKPGERQVNFRWSLNFINQGKVRVWWGSEEGQRKVRWWSGGQVNLNLRLTLVDVKIVDFKLYFQHLLFSELVVLYQSWCLFVKNYFQNRYLLFECISYLCTNSLIIKTLCWRSIK